MSCNLYRKLYNDKRLPSEIKIITTYEPRHEISNNVILTSVDSDEPVQPPFKLRNSKWYSVSSNIQVTSKGSDQAARMRRLI